jgi:hypothetical protein
MPQCGITNFIYGSECIGDSLVKINDNFSSLESYVCDLSSSTITVTDTSMVSLSYNNITRNLEGYINDRSLTNYKLAFDEGNYGFRNKLINGSFDFWQRGSMFAGITGPALVFTADRWGVLANSSTVTVKQEPFNAISPSSQFASLNPEFHNPKYFLSYSITSPGTSNVWPRLFQRIENVKTLAGRKTTVSFYAYTTAPVQVKVFFKQFITTSPTTTVTSSSITQTLQPGSWKKYEYVITLPTSPISGATAAYNYLSNEDYLELCIDIDNNAASPVFFSCVQAEAGTRATAFEVRPYETELKFCQRFYEKSYEVEIAPGTNTKIGAQILVHGSVTNNGIKLISQMQTAKRIVPGIGHVKLHHPTTGNASNVNPNLANTSADMNIVLDNAYTSSKQLVAQFSGGASPTTNSTSTWHYVVDVEYI